jgi:hypothetical protein
MYLKVIESASDWRRQLLSLPKLTPQTVQSISPPIAVFERAQSGGRPVMAVSKKVAFNQFLFTQPLIDASEGGIPGYAGGDRKHLLRQFLQLISGEWSEIGKGDDNAIRLKDGTIVGSDASAFDAAVSDSENRAYIRKVAEHLSGDDEKVWVGSCYSANQSELVTNVGQVQRPPMWGVTSGEPNTSHKGTILTLDRAKKAPRSSVKAVLEHMNKFGPYRLEFQGKGFVILLKLMVTDRKPDVIHGSYVRGKVSFSQRDDPVLEKRAEEFWLEEEARLSQVGGNQFGHELFERFCEWARENWEFRQDRTRTSERAVDLMIKDRDRGASEIGGEYEREGIKAVRDLVS